MPKRASFTRESGHPVVLRGVTDSVLFRLDEHTHHIALEEDTTVKIGCDVTSGTIITEDKARGKVPHGDVAVIRKLVDREDLSRIILDVLHSRHIAFLLRLA